MSRGHLIIPLEASFALDISAAHHIGKPVIKQYVIAGIPDFHSFFGTLDFRSFGGIVFGPLGGAEAALAFAISKYLMATAGFMIWLSTSAPH